MNARDLAAGVICVGFDGSVLSEATRSALTQHRFAGVILFGRNVQTVEQTRALTDEVRSCYRELAPVIAIDQEGGRVARIREGVVEMPSMMTLGATGRPALARTAGEQMAHDLRRIGVNVDFAPVLDLATHGENTVIGARAFSDDPQTVRKFGEALSAGLEAGGVVATFKHFPGHGSTVHDSHLELPVVEADEETLRSRELVPFAALLPHARAVMSAHIVMRAFDPVHPATAAKRILTGLLRDEIGFKGVCFTDCMEMDAIAKTVGTAGGAVLALKAGADCVLISHRIELALEAIERIHDAVESGELPLLRLQEAYDRVQSLRRSLEPPIALDSPPLHPNIGTEIAKAAVTQVSGAIPTHPLAAVVVSFEGTTTEGAQGKHVPPQVTNTNAGNFQWLFYPLEPPSEAIDHLLHQLDSEDARVIILARRAHVYGAQAAAIDRILAAFPDALLISLREPGEVERFAQARNVLAFYGDELPNFEALGHVLHENGARPGTLPVRWPAAR